MSDLRLSNSEIKMWNRCKRQWYLTSYRRLKRRAPETPNSSLSIGNAVHDALAAYYELGTDPVAYVEAVAAEKTEQSPHNEREIEKELSLCRAMLSGYLEWLAETGEDSDLIFHGAERMIAVKLRSQGGDTGVVLLSKLDAPVERVSDGAKLAIEHKTVTSLDQHLPEAKLNTQFLHEHLARFLELQERGATPDEAVHECQGVLLNMLRKVKRTATAKPPFYSRMDVPHNVLELRNHWRHVMHVARAIQEATARLDDGANHQDVVPPNPTHDCHWDCPFFNVCVMHDDGSDVEGALGAMFETFDPLERYAGAEPV